MARTRNYASSGHLLLTPTDQATVTSHTRWYPLNSKVESQTTEQKEHDALFRNPVSQTHHRLPQFPYTTDARTLLQLPPTLVLHLLTRFGPTRLPDLLFRPGPYERGETLVPGLSGRPGAGEGSLRGRGSSEGDRLVGRAEGGMEGQGERSEGEV